MIIGGVSFSTLLSLFLIPALYLLLARLTKPSGYVADRLRNLEEEYSIVGDGARSAPVIEIPAPSTG